MKVFNGSCKIQDNRPVTSVQTDACSDGDGTYFGGDYYYVNWLVDLQYFAPKHINVKELLAIFLAIITKGMCN